MGDSTQKAHLMHTKSIHKPYLYKYGLRMALVWFKYGLCMVCHITGVKWEDKIKCTKKIYFSSFFAKKNPENVFLQNMNAKMI